MKYTQGEIILWNLSKPPTHSHPVATPNLNISNLSLTLVISLIKSIQKENCDVKRNQIGSPVREILHDL